MFKIGDVVEITEESDATGMLDFKDGNGYKVINRHSHQEILLQDEGGHIDWYHYTHFKLMGDTIVEKKESLFKEGQVVWDLHNGRGVVEEITRDERYPVKVRFDLKDMDGDEITDHYTADGRYAHTQTVRSLYFSEPKIEAATEPLFEPTLEKGDVVVAVDKAGCSKILYVSEEFERQVKNTQGTFFYKESFDFYRLGDKINFK